MSAMNRTEDYSSLRVGDPVPAFILSDPEGTKWSPLEFDIAGEPVLVLFETAGPDAAATGLADILSLAGPLAGKPLTIFHIKPGPLPSSPSPEVSPPGGAGSSYHLLGDPDGGTFGAYGVVPGSGGALVAVLLDHNCRIAGIAAAAPGESPAGEISACIDKINNGRAAGAGTPHAPVLVIPRLLDERECQRCIDLWHRYEADHRGAGHSDIDEGGKTFLNDFGAMKQYLVEEPEPQAWLDSIIGPRVTEEISKAFMTRAANREFYALLRYDSANDGHVRRHRDCATSETEHRRFTVSVMLNDDYQGGALKFREYSDDLYQLPRGYAVVYSSALLHEVMPVSAGTRFAIAFHLYG